MGTLGDEVRWGRNLFNMIAIGGMWTVPRSGLIFTKKDNHTLELTVVIPFLEEMKEAAAQGRDVPKSKEDLVKFQQADFDTISKRFGEAGITMIGREKIGKE